ncbi:MAG: diacylglycerol kinase family lipid kinase [Flammeovirgaceae bacterium]|nr:diacylglycerol kinase family lipid kinase [Flammeovirgaceae bacterium]MDW8288012.1 diacylglycerol kinase family lipid kinase [Flammeovirgaceae bacterium]
MTKLLFVINPIAGGRDKNAFLKNLETYATTYEFDYRYYLTKGNDDQQEISRQLVDYEPDTVVAVGGDGTLLLVAELLINTPIALGVVPMGSANGMAKELDIPTAEDEAMELLVSGHVRQLDMLHINKKRFCLHIADIGFNAKIVKHFQQNKLRGLIGYALHFFREFHTTQPHIFELEIDDKEKFTYESYMIAFANARKYGTGAVLNPLGKPDDGWLEVCILKELSYLSMINMLLTTEDDPDTYPSEHLDIISCKKAVVRTSLPLPLQSDGELIGEVNEVVVEIYPKCLQVICPS